MKLLILKLKIKLAILKIEREIFLTKRIGDLG